MSPVDVESCEDCRFHELRIMELEAALARIQGLTTDAHRDSLRDAVKRVVQGVL